MINKETALIISLSAKPSNFGTTLHNVGYKHLGLNFIYKAMTTNNLENALLGIRALGIRGCSLSMPFKELALPFMDELDSSAKITGAVNTILNDSNKLIGYNTDLIGAKVVLSTFKIPKNAKIMILGSGGVARAILAALIQLNFINIQIASRNEKKTLLLNDIGLFESIPWEQRENTKVDLLINATPIGMIPNINDCPVSKKFISKTVGVMDVIVSLKNTMLIEIAKNTDIDYVQGYKMSLEQAIEQFNIYTGVRAPRNIMQRAIKEII
jgi:shikimate dehydrogenase